MAGVVFFDIDGTLTSAAVSSSAAHLASMTGNADRVVAAEAACARGELTDADVCVVDAAGFAGVAVADVDRWLDELPSSTGSPRWSSAAASAASHPCSRDSPGDP